MAMSSLNDLLEMELRDIYWAEKALVKALPKMAKAASSEKLKSGIEEHLEQTEGHVERLEEVFSLLELTARAKKCEAMAGLVEEGSELLKEDAEPAVRDAAIIAAAQKVEHYEIAAYGTLCAWAKLLGHDQVAEILGATLEEEKQTDQKLSELAENEINVEAE